MTLVHWLSNTLARRFFFVLIVAGFARAAARNLAGRSPRGRRSRLSRLPERTAQGSISARAEEPVWHSQAEICGGSISARAEEPAPAKADGLPKRVDLRAGGGAVGWRAELEDVRVDLRAGGGAAKRGGFESVRKGRSPRGRRSHAGIASEVRAERVDLRAGGGADPGQQLPRAHGGRSPRGRRSRRTARYRGCASRVDLRAGGGACALDSEPARKVDLRAGGGAFDNVAWNILGQGRSPRGRRSRKSHASERD